MEKKVFFIIGLLGGIIVTLFFTVILMNTNIVIDWHLFFVISLILLITAYVLKRKHIDQYSIYDHDEDNESSEFNIITGEIFVDYDKARRINNEDPKLQLKDIDLGDNCSKDFILLESNYSYFKIKDAVKCGKEEGYSEAGVADLVAFIKYLEEKDSIYNVIETKDCAYSNSQGPLLIYINKKKEFSRTFSQTRVDSDFVVLMVKEKEVIQD